MLYWTIGAVLATGITAFILGAIAGGLLLEYDGGTKGQE